MVFIQLLIPKNRFNTAWNWSLYRNGHVHLAINKTKMADDIAGTVYFSNWCMVTESIMKWVFWYVSYIIFLYKHWNVECVWDNHPFILHLLDVFYILVYWLILDVLILVVFYMLEYWLILDVLIMVVFYILVYWLIKVSCNGCFDTVVLSLVQLYWPSHCPGSIQLSSTQYDCTWT